MSTHTYHTFQGIAPTLIALRVATGKARDSAAWSQPLSSLRFRKTTANDDRSLTVENIDNTNGHMSLLGIAQGSDEAALSQVVWTVMHTLINTSLVRHWRMSVNKCSIYLSGIWMNLTRTILVLLDQAGHTWCVHALEYLITRANWGETPAVIYVWWGKRTTFLEYGTFLSSAELVSFKALKCRRNYFERFKIKIVYQVSHLTNIWHLQNHQFLHLIIFYVPGHHSSETVNCFRIRTTLFARWTSKYLLHTFKMSWICQEKSEYRQVLIDW